MRENKLVYLENLWIPKEYTIGFISIKDDKIVSIHRESRPILLIRINSNPCMDK